MPLDADHEFSGHWLQFLNPYALLTGITTLALMMLHGHSTWSMKTEGRLFVKIVILMRRSIIAFLVLSHWSPYIRCCTSHT